MSLLSTNEGPEEHAGWVDSMKKTVKEILLWNPEEIKVVALTPIGYPSEDAGLFSKAIKNIVGSKKRKPIEEMVHSEKW